MLRNQAPPAGMPAVAPTRSARTPTVPAPTQAAPLRGPISLMSQAARSAPANTTPPSVVQQAAALPRGGTPQPGQPVSEDLARRQALVQSVLGKQLGSGPITQMNQAAASPDPLAGLQVSDTSVPGVRRIDGGNSPLFTNIDPAQAAAQMRGGTVNTVPAASFGAGRGPVSTAAAMAAGQPAGVTPSYGMIGDSSQADRERKRLVEAASTPYRGAQNGQLTANQLRTLAGVQEMEQRAASDAAGLDMRQQELTQRAAEGQQRLSLDQQRLGLEAPGAQGQQLQNEQSQLMLDLTRKAIGGDAEALKQLQALQGKDPKNPQAGLLQELMKAWAQGSASGMGNGMPLATMLQEAGPILQMALGMPGATTPAPQPFVEGQTYLDANGNRARFVGGQWMEVE